MKYSTSSALVGTSLTIAVTAGAQNIPLPQTDSTSFAGPALTITNSAGSTAKRWSAIEADETGELGIGVYGISSGLGGYGVLGQASGANSRGVVGTNSDTGFAGWFTLTGEATTSSNATVMATHAGGSKSVGGNYGQAGNFQITNANNGDVALYATTAGGGSTIIAQSSTGAQTKQPTVAADLFNGNDAAFKGGEGVAALNAFDDSAPGSFTYAVYAKSTNNIAVRGISSNISASFIGGSEGSGSCTFKGGAGWECTSDRNQKDHLQSVDSPALLERLQSMPVYSYQMKNSNQPTRYLGPTAQDFKAAFDLGEDDTVINTANAQGVALAAAKALYEKVKTDERDLTALRGQVEQQSRELAELKRQNQTMQAALEGPLSRTDRVAMRRE